MSEKWAVLALMSFCTSSCMHDCGGGESATLAASDRCSCLEWRTEGLRTFLQSGPDLQLLYEKLVAAFHIRGCDWFPGRNKRLFVWIIRSVLKLNHASLNKKLSTLFLSKHWNINSQIFVPYVLFFYMAFLMREIFFDENLAHVTYIIIVVMMYF
jgi:hypothetical protein